MQPFKTRIARLVEQLAPNLPGSAAEVVRAALGVGEATNGAAKPFPCLARPGLMPDLSALLGRRGPLHRSRPGDPAEGTEGGTFSTHTASSPAGVYSYKLFEPGLFELPTALVVMLHGCTQNADDFAAGTRMNALARTENLLVVYPEQARGANPSGCWNWFLARNQRRGDGEPAAIASIVGAVMTAHGIGAGRVMVAGLSAGGAMAAIMAEAYPELFAAVGIHSGLPVGAAHDVASAFAAMRHATAGAAANAAATSDGVPTIVFHGDADSTVDPGNAAAIVARLHARESGLRPATQHGVQPNGRSWIKATGRDAAGRLRFESWTVKGATHAWSGGSPAGSYTDPSGPDASGEMIRFFRDQLGMAASKDPRRLLAG